MFPSHDRDELFGDNYNTEFLKTLASVASEKNKEVDKNKFNYLKDLNRTSEDISDSQIEDNFNKDIADSILTHPRWNAKAPGKENDTTSRYGNIDDRNKEYYRLHTKGDKTEVISDKAE